MAKKVKFSKLKPSDEASDIPRCLPGQVWDHLADGCHHGQELQGQNILSHQQLPVGKASSTMTASRVFISHTVSKGYIDWSYPILDSES